MTRLEAIRDALVRPFTKGRFLEANAEAAGLPTRPPVNPYAISAPEYDRVNRRIAGSLYESSPALRTCVDRIAERAKQVPIKAYKRPTKTQDWADDDGPLSRLMGWFNPDDGPTSYMEKCVKYLITYQRLYVGVEDNDLPNKVLYPKNFYPLNPAYLDKVPNEDGSHFYKYDPGGAGPAKVYLAHEIIKCEPGIALNDNYHGSNPLNAAIGDIAQEKANRDYINRFLTRKMPITGVLNLGDPNISEESLLTYELQLNNGSSTNKFGILPLKKDDKYTAIPTDQAAFQAAGIQSGSVTTIQWLYGVPLPILTGDSRDLEAVEEAFWSGTVLPVLLLIAEAHDKWVQINPTLGVKYKIMLDTSKVFALKRALINLVKVAVAMVSTGQMTPNEGRMFCGMTPLPKGTYDDLTDWPNQMVPPMTSKMLANNAAAQATAQAGVANDRGNAGASNGASPSLSTPGQGGRDQGKDGEAQMVDTSGKKSITKEMVERWFDLDGEMAGQIAKEIEMEAFLSGR